MMLNLVEKRIPTTEESKECGGANIECYRKVIQIKAALNYSFMAYNFNVVKLSLNFCIP